MEEAEDEAEEEWSSGPVIKRPAGAKLGGGPELQGSSEEEVAEDAEIADTEIEADDEGDLESTGEVAAGLAGVEPPCEASGPAVHATKPPHDPPLKDWRKTYAGRYMPKPAAGSAAWLMRRKLFFTLVPEAYQTSRLQLSFWKFCAEQVKQGGLSEEEAAQEFVRQGSLAAAAD